jgi:hypothetical protein
MIKLPKIKLNLIFWISIFCFINYVLMFIGPIYFINATYRQIYFLVVFILLLALVVFRLARYINRQGKRSFYWALPWSLLVAITFFMVFGFITLSTFLAVWTEASTIYVSKSNPNVKIISRYLNLGAFGGGTSPDDFETVVDRPLTPFFKMETKVDTNRINKQEWIRLGPTYYIK